MCSSQLATAGVCGLRVPLQGPIQARLSNLGRWLVLCELFGAAAFAPLQQFRRSSKEVLCLKPSCVLCHLLDTICQGPIGGGGGPVTSGGIRKGLCQGVAPTWMFPPPPPPPARFPQSNLTHKDTNPKKAHIHMGVNVTGRPFAGYHV